MSNIMFGTDNKAVGATYSLLSGSPNAQFPLSNVDKVFTTKSFRSTGTSCVIQIDWASAQSVDTFMMVGNNLTGMGVTSATIEFSPTSVFPGTSIETINLSADHNLGFVKFTSGSYRYAKLTLTGTSYCELSNIYIGARTEIVNNSFDTTSFNYSLVDKFKSKANNYGQLFIDEYNKVNQLGGTFKYVNDAEFAQLNTMYAESGNTTPVWFMLDSDGSLVTDGEFIFSGYFYLSGNLSWKSVAPGLFDITINLNEVV